MRRVLSWARLPHIRYCFRAGWAWITALVEIIPCVSEYLTQMTVLIYAEEQSETDQFKVLANASSAGTWFE